MGQRQSSHHLATLWLSQGGTHGLAWSPPSPAMAPMGDKCMCPGSEEQHCASSGKRDVGPHLYPIDDLSLFVRCGAQPRWDGAGQRGCFQHFFPVLLKQLYLHRGGVWQAGGTDQLQHSEQQTSDPSGFEFSHRAETTAQKINAVLCFRKLSK